MFDHFMLLTGLGLSLLLAYTAFLFNWVQLSSVATIIIIGTIVLGFGGWYLAIGLVIFFAGSSLLTQLKINGNKTLEHQSRNIYLDEDLRRDSYQVWANGFWVSVFCILFFLLNSDLFLIAAFAAIAAAAADTWATEVGIRKAGKTKKITDFTPVEPGTDGGISLMGSLGALGGAFSVASVLLISDFQASSQLFSVVLISGFLGCVADSYFGVFIKNNSVIKKMVNPDLPLNEHSLKNNVVNWLATGCAGLTAILFTQLF